MRPPRVVRHGHPPFLGWAILVVLLLVVKLGQGDNPPDCDNLELKETKDEQKNQWLLCMGQIFKLNKNKEENYPVTDISDLNQTEFDTFTQTRQLLIENDNTTKIFVGNLLCSNSSLERITKLAFGFEEENILQSVELVNNLHLTNVDFKTDITSKKKGRIRFTISGNRRLSKTSIDTLNSITFQADDSYIQEFGECDITETIASLKDLEGCHYTKGNLTIDNTTDLEGTFPPSLTQIRGCLHIKNTVLKDLKLLDGITNSTCEDAHEISGNKDLCLHPSEVSDLHDRFKKMKNKLKFESNDPCKGRCTWEYLNKAKDKKCLIVEGVIKLQRVKESDNLTYLSQVEEIHGRLLITHTDLSKINMFPKLQKIYCNLSEHALLITNNMKLTSLDFPALERIIMKENVRVLSVKENNKEFIMDDDQYEKWKNITGGDENKLEVPRKSAAPEQVFVVDSNSTSSKEESVVVEEDNSAVIGIGVGVTLGVIVVLGVITGVTVFAVIKCSQRKKKKKRDEEQAKINERLRHADVADWSSVDSSSFNSIRSIHELGGSVPLCDENTVREVPGVQTLDIYMHDYNAVVHDPFYMANRKYNMECTRTTDQELMTIKRDCLGVELLKEKDVAAPCSEPVDKYYTHNMKYRLYTIQPRKENTKEYIYDIKKGCEFDPFEFINACMQSSNVALTERAINAALDYAEKNQVYGNPDQSGHSCQQLIEIRGPINILGDTHGSLMDLQAMFSIDSEDNYTKKKLHPMFENKYIFAGDYLDRGIYDFVNFAFLAVLSAKYPTRFFLLRGNHEFMRYQDMKGSFQMHVQYEYNPLEKSLEIVEKIRRLCSNLPIAAIIDQKIFICHGGISRAVNEQIIEFKKESDEIDVRKIFYDMAPFPLEADDKITVDVAKKEKDISQWKEQLEALKNGGNKKEPEKKRTAAGTDPGANAPPMTAAALEAKINEETEAIKKLKFNQTFGRIFTWSDPSLLSINGNSRGMGHTFNEDDVKTFLEINKFQFIVRGHESVGFHQSFGGRLFSIFAQFHYYTNVIGFPYAFADEECMRITKAHLPGTLSVGMLRCATNGTLTMLMLRHAYLDDDSKAAKGPKEKPIKFKREFDAEANAYFIEKGAEQKKVEPEKKETDKKKGNDEVPIRTKGSAASSRKENGGKEDDKEKKEAQAKSELNVGQNSKMSQKSELKTNKSEMGGANSSGNASGAKSKQESGSNVESAPKKESKASDNPKNKPSPMSKSKSEPSPKT